jgi:hypothetical protein
MDYRCGSNGHDSLRQNANRCYAEGGISEEGDEEKKKLMKMVVVPNAIIEVVPPTLSLRNGLICFAVCPCRVLSLPSHAESVGNPDIFDGSNSGIQHRLQCLVGSSHGTHDIGEMLTSLARPRRPGIRKDTSFSCGCLDGLTHAYVCWGCSRVLTYGVFGHSSHRRWPQFSQTRVLCVNVVLHR